MKKSLSCICTIVLAVISCGNLEADEEDKTPDFPFNISIPVISINTVGYEPVVSKEEYVKGTIVIRDPNKYYTDGNELTLNMKIKGRGNTTWDDPKKPYRIKLDESASILGMNKSKNWCLLAEYEDKSLLRNMTGMELSRICQMPWTPSMVGVELFLNGEYLGYYTFCEHKEVSKNKVNIDPDNGDFYMEIEQNMDNPVCFWTDHLVPMMFSDPENPTPEQKEYVIGRFKEFERILYSDSYTDPDDGYAGRIDVESVINYFIVEELAKNIDGNLRKSSFITLGEKSPLVLYHVWDFDRAFGNCSYMSTEYPGATDDYTGWFIKDFTLKGNEGWYARFFSDPEFVARVKTRWKELYPQLEKMPEFIDAKAASIDEAQTRNFVKWDILNSKPYPVRVQTLKDFYVSRLHWLNDAIDNL